MQREAAPGERARVVAANNILNALFMVSGALLLMLGFALGLGIPQLFLLLSFASLAAAAFIAARMPQGVCQFLCRLAARALYRLRVEGLENFPAAGPALLVSNHVSFVDWLIIAAACPRPVCFVMHHDFLKIPFARQICRNARVIPIAGLRENPALLRAALDRIAAELAAGNLVGIFPEGCLTRSGEMGPFRPGVEWIVARTPVPVVPMALKGMWGSFFSRKYGRAMTRPFRRVYARITLAVGQAVPPDEVTAPALRAIVERLLRHGAAA
jgi:1-acyl-sn-glycerol-3-phosphate acyltransferase